VAQDQRDASQFGVPHARAELAAKTDPHGRCLVVKVPQLPRDDGCLSPFGRQAGSASSTARRLVRLEK
jgi:hypothetical protein